MTTTIAQANPLRCFPRPATFVRPATEPAAHTWVDRWSRQFCRNSWRLDDRQEQALSHLVPSLLCGEQSAQQVFHKQANKMRGSSVSKLASALRQIEREEYAHERALQTLAAGIMTPADLHSRKRRAQRFYASLSRSSSLGEHFARIAALDSFVCRIMDSLSRAQQVKKTPLRYLFDAIKSDEVRHVAVSRRYARMLGIDSTELIRQKRLIGFRIVHFLQPEADAFECLGVDPDQLFLNLEPGRRL